MPSSSSKPQVSTGQSVPGDNCGQKQKPRQTLHGHVSASLPLCNVVFLASLLTNWLESTSGRSESFQGPLRVSGQPARGVADVSLWQPSGLVGRPTPTNHSSPAPHPFSHPSQLNVQVINPSTTCQNFLTPQAWSTKVHFSCVLL